MMYCLKALYPIGLFFGSFLKRLVPWSFIERKNWANTKQRKRRPIFGLFSSIVLTFETSARNWNASPKVDRVTYIWKLSCISTQILAYILSFLRPIPIEIGALLQADETCCANVCLEYFHPSLLSFSLRIASISYVEGFPFAQIAPNSCEFTILFSLPPSFCC